jgi:nitrous oxide reductase accessory protein NosL
MNVQLAYTAPISWLRARRGRVAVAAIALMALLVAACGSSDDTTTSIASDVERRGHGDAAAPVLIEQWGDFQ